MSTEDDTRRRLVWHGMLLFLLGCSPDLPNRGSRICGWRCRPISRAL
jgi:hypothetical protein